MLTAYHPCRVPVMWAAQQLGFDMDQPEEVRGANQGNPVAPDAAAGLLHIGQHAAWISWWLCGMRKVPRKLCSQCISDGCAAVL